MNVPHRPHYTANLDFEVPWPASTAFPQRAKKKQAEYNIGPEDCKKTILTYV